MHDLNTLSTWYQQRYILYVDQSGKNIKNNFDKELHNKTAFYYLFL
jgi:hypothetical protein